MTASLPPRIERARMALCEIGADPSIVTLDSDGRIRPPAPCWEHAVGCRWRINYWMKWWGPRP